MLFSPGEVTRSYGRFKPSTHHGTVAPGDWDRKHHHFGTNALAKAALRHWRDGVAWEDTGVVEVQLRRIEEYGPIWADRLATRDDIMRRYERLDELYELVRRTGELPAVTHTEDRIYIHLDRDGRAVFGHRGVHRFVITHLLGVPDVPARLGAVHPEAPQALGLRVGVRVHLDVRARAVPEGTPEGDTGVQGRGPLARLLRTAR